MYRILLSMMASLTILAFGFVNLSVAAPVTYQISSTVTSLLDADSLLDSSVFIGAAVSVEITFDPTQSADTDAATNAGEYFFDTPSADYIVNVGNYNFSLGIGQDSFFISLLDSFGSGAILINGSSNLVGSSSADATFSSIGGSLGGVSDLAPSVNVGDVNDISTLPDDLGGPFLDFLVSGNVVDPDNSQNSLGTFFILHSVPSIVKVVPEPATLTLFGLGLLGLGAARHRRKIAA
jgi:hypothetical protein